MYYYILDSHKLSLQKFESLQVELQGLLAEFNISGDMGRVTALRSMSDLIETASQRGAKTIVACGSDDTFNIMLALLKGRDFTVGFIPLDQHSYLGKILGLDNLHTAAKTIAARRIEKIDLAICGNTYFMSFIEFGINREQLRGLSLWNSFNPLSSPTYPLTLRIDGNYTIQTNCASGIIANTRPLTADVPHIANPTDGLLDLMLVENMSKRELMKYRDLLLSGSLEHIPHTSVIKCKSVELLEPRGLPISMSDRIITKFPATVEIIPKRLKMIVGKNRTF